MVQKPLLSFVLITAMFVWPSAAVAQPMGEDIGAAPTGKASTKRIELDEPMEVSGEKHGPRVQFVESGLESARRKMQQLLGETRAGAFRDAEVSRPIRTAGVELIITEWPKEASGREMRSVLADWTSVLPFCKAHLTDQETTIGLVMESQAGRGATYAGRQRPSVSEKGNRNRGRVFNKQAQPLSPFEKCGIRLLRKRNDRRQASPSTEQKVRRIPFTLSTFKTER